MDDTWQNAMLIFRVSMLNNRLMEWLTGFKCRRKIKGMRKTGQTGTVHRV